MRRRGVIGGLLAGAALFSLGGCQTGFTHRLRVRMTVEVTTPQGLKSGSAVYELTAASVYDPTLPNDRMNNGMWGQAAVVDLADGPIFTLLTLPHAGGDLEEPVISALNGARPVDQADWVAIVGRLSKETRRADLPRNQWPMMVRFRDLNDPKSVEAVDADAIGVKRVWVETTLDPVTTGIEHQLKWLIGHHGALSYDGTTHPEAPEKDLGAYIRA